MWLLIMHEKQSLETINLIKDFKGENVVGFDIA
jgi:hypothetical protein